MPRTSATKRRAKTKADDETDAIRRIDNGARLFGERCDVYAKRLRNNVGELSPYRRQVLSAWLKRHHERLQATLDEASSIPPLDLGTVPDLGDD